jgi:hypothetical protein
MPSCGIGRPALAGRSLIVAALGLSPGTSTACRRFGTQLECTLGSTRIFIGTQAEAEPSHERSLPIQSFHRGLGIGLHEPAFPGPVDIELQDFATDLACAERSGTKSTATDLGAARGSARLETT